MNKILSNHNLRQDIDNELQSLKKMLEIAKSASCYLFATSLAFLFCVGGANAQVVSMNFDGLANSTNDFGSNVTVSGGAQVSTAAQFSGTGSLYLPGGVSYITLNDPALNFGLNPFSISFEMLALPLQTTYAVVMGIGYHDFNIGIPSEAGQTGMYAQIGETYVSTGPGLANGNWHSVVFQRNTDSFSLTVDGVQAPLGSASISASTMVNLNGLRIGKWGGNEAPDNSFNGYIDNLVISAVPEPETYAMMLAGLGLLGFTARRKASINS